MLNNTGTAATNGGLTVTGNGGNCTIADPTCTGGTIRNTTGDGIALDNTKNVSLSFVRVLDTGRQGIFGRIVDGFTFKNSLNIGAGNGNEEHGIFFENDATTTTVNHTGTALNGTFLIQDVVIDSPIQWGLRVNQASGTMNMTVRRLTVQNNRNVDGLNLGADAVSMTIRGGASNVLVDDSDFLNVDGGVTGQAGGSSPNPGTLDLTVQNSNWNQVESLPFGINFNTFFQGTGRLKATGNTMVGCTGVVPTNRCSQGIDLDASTNSRLDATILNNTISDTGIGGGMQFIVNENAVGRAEIRDNTVTVPAGQIGLDFFARSTDAANQTGSLDTTVEGNTISTITTAFLPAYAVQDRGERHEPGQPCQQNVCKPLHGRRRRQQRRQRDDGD